MTAEPYFAESQLPEELADPPAYSEHIPERQLLHGPEGAGRSNITNNDGPPPAYHPIGIFKKFAYQTPRKLVIKQSDLFRTDLNVYLCQDDNLESRSTSGSAATDGEEDLKKILSGTSPYITGNRQRMWSDAETNRSLFRVYNGSFSRSWTIEAVNSNGVPARLLTTITPHSYSACWFDRYDMYLTGGDGMQQTSKIEIRGEKINKSRLTVYCHGQVIMKIRRTDPWAYLLLCAKRLTWEVDLATGVDASLAAIIVGLSSDIL